MTPGLLSSLQQWGRVNTDHNASIVRFSGLGRPRVAQKQVYFSAHTAFRTQPASVGKARAKRNTLSDAPWPILLTEQRRDEDHFSGSQAGTFKCSALTQLQHKEV